jgi:hypothetical protein
MDGVDTPAKPKAQEDAEPGGIADIAVKNGDLVLQIEHANANLDVTLHSFRVSTTALKAKSKYFERLLEAGRFGEGQQIISQHEALLKKFASLALAPATELPVIRIEDLGRISAVKSIRPLLTDFLLILHDQDTQATPPVSNLANLAIVADRFDALDAVRLHVRRKSSVPSTPKPNQSKTPGSRRNASANAYWSASCSITLLGSRSTASGSLPKAGSGKKLSWKIRYGGTYQIASKKNSSCAAPLSSKLYSPFRRISWRSTLRARASVD